MSLGSTTTFFRNRVYKHLNEMKITGNQNMETRLKVSCRSMLKVIIALFRVCFKGDLGQTPRTPNIETEYFNTKVLFSLNSFLSCIEFFALRRQKNVNIFTVINTVTIVWYLSWNLTYDTCSN